MKPGESTESEEVQQQCGADEALWSLKRFLGKLEIPDGVWDAFEAVEAEVLRLRRAEASGAKGTPTSSEAAPDVSANVPVSTDERLTSEFISEVHKHQGEERWHLYFNGYVMEAVAREVSRLREENADLTKRNAYAWSDGFNSASAGLAENEAEELLAPYKAKLARVEALPAKWREGRRRVWGDPTAEMPWADEIEAALKAE